MLKKEKNTVIPDSQESNASQNQIVSEYVDKKLQMMLSQYSAWEKMREMGGGEVFLKDYEVFLENFHKQPVHPFPHLDEIMRIKQPMTQEQMAARCEAIDEKCDINYNNFRIITKAETEGEIHSEQPYVTISLVGKMLILPSFSDCMRHSIANMSFLGDTSLGNINLELPEIFKIAANIYVDIDNKQAFLETSKDEKDYYFELSEFCMLTAWSKHKPIKNELAHFVVFNKELGFFHQFVEGRPNLSYAKLSPITTDTEINATNCDL